MIDIGGEMKQSKIQGSIARGCPLKVWMLSDLDFPRKPVEYGSIC